MKINIEKTPVIPLIVSSVLFAILATVMIGINAIIGGLIGFAALFVFLLAVWSFLENRRNTGNNQ